MKTNAAPLREHVYRLADQCGTRVVHRGRGIAYRRERLITVPEIRGPVSYFVALHELGHIVGPNPRLRLSQEVAAWKWALDNSIIDPPRSVYRHIAKCLDAYFWRAFHRRGMRIPDDFAPFYQQVRKWAE